MEKRSLDAGVCLQANGDKSHRCSFTGSEDVMKKTQMCQYSLSLVKHNYDYDYDYTFTILCDYDYNYDYNPNQPQPCQGVEYISGCFFNTKLCLTLLQLSLGYIPLNNTIFLSLAFLTKRLAYIGYLIFI